MANFIFLLTMLSGFLTQADEPYVFGLKTLDCRAENGVVITTVSNDTGYTIVAAKLGFMTKNFYTGVMDLNDGKYEIILDDENKYYYYSIKMKLNPKLKTTQSAIGQLFRRYGTGSTPTFLSDIQCEVILKTANY